ncbi:MAG: c-type cytochrome domain-containing protein [Candidatus Krumholzibacteriia bacterium]
MSFRPGTIGILVLLTGLAQLAACSDNGTEPQLDDAGGGEPTVSFAADVQPIFDANCIGCHGAVGGNGGMSLVAGSSYDNLVGVPSQGYAGDRVVPGDPDASVLYRKLTGAQGVGGPMPPTGILPPATVEPVRIWIAEGAIDN